MMTSRERLTRLFKGQDLDRVPIWLLSPYHKVGFYADIYNLDCYKRIVPRIDKDCEILDRRGVETGFCFNGCTDIKRSFANRFENGNHIEEDTVSYKDFSLNKTISKGKDGTRLKYMVEDAEDLLKILDMPYTPLQPDLTQYFREKAELGDKGLMMGDIGDPLCPLYHLMSAENFSIMTATDYDTLLVFLDEMYRRVYNLYKYLLEHDFGEVFFIVGCEFAGPPLVSPDKFNEMSVRYVKGICDLIRQYDKWSIVHYHGNLYKVLDGMKAMNPNGLHTIEAPPIGDCTITQAREKLGKDTILIGNIQYDDLAHLEKHEIEDLVRLAMAEGKSGRFILSPTAGPYESVINDKLIENYLAFIDAGLKYGKL